MATTDRAEEPKAPHGRCGCGAPLVTDPHEVGEGEVDWEGRHILWCSASDEHAPCPVCERWVRWRLSRITGRVVHETYIGRFKTLVACDKRAEDAT